MLPCRELDSGIPRVTEAWPDIELIDDRRGNQFKAVIRRPYTREVSGDVGINSGSSEDQIAPRSQRTPEIYLLLTTITYAAMHTVCRATRSAAWRWYARSASKAGIQ
jgi:hypothetical protein